MEGERPAEKTPHLKLVFSNAHSILTLLSIVAAVVHVQGGINWEELLEGDNRQEGVMGF